MSPAHRGPPGAAALGLCSVCWLEHGSLGLEHRCLEPASLSMSRKDPFGSSAAFPRHYQKVGHPSPHAFLIWGECRIQFSGVIKNVPNIIGKVNLMLFI